MDNLDLDINNYTIKDIEAFFKIKTNVKYTAADIELKEYEIREQLLKSNHINKRFKTDLIDFLTKAKQWLIVVKCNKTALETQPTTIPKNYKLDPLDTPASKEPPSRLEELVTRPERQFIYSNPSEYFPGTLNPLNTRVITKTLNIDTRFRENLYSTLSTDFNMNIPSKLNKVVSMQLSSIELPLVFYNISESFGNNYLYIKVSYNAFDKRQPNVFNNPVFDKKNILNEEIIDDNELNKEILEAEIEDENLFIEALTEDIRYDNKFVKQLVDENIFIIPDGNYSSHGLINTINNILSPLDETGALLNPSSIFSYIEFSLDIDSHNSGTGKVTIRPSKSHVNFINRITLDFTKNRNGTSDTTSLFTKIGWNLGFIKPKYDGNKFYISDTVFDMNSIRYIYLAIDDFNNNANNQFISIFNKSILNPNILARISIKGTHFSSLQENNFNIITEPRQYFGPVDIQRLKIQLYDEFGRILNINNANFSFCLDFKLMYDL